MQKVISRYKYDHRPQKAKAIKEVAANVHALTLFPSCRE